MVVMVVVVMEVVVLWSGARRHAMLEGGVNVQVGGALVVGAGHGEGDGAALGAGIGG